MKTIWGKVGAIVAAAALFMHIRIMQRTDTDACRKHDSGKYPHKDFRPLFSILSHIPPDGTRQPVPPPS